MSSIADYKKQHPEYANIPDLDLAETLYNKTYKGKIDESDFYKQAFPNIAAKRVSEDIMFPDDEFGSNFEFKGTESKFKPITSEIAKISNVAINDPASSKARFGASLGYNQEQKKLAVKNSLSKLYNQDVDVRVGPNTGELEYYNPKTKQYALVDAPGVDLGDFADLGGDAMIVIPDLVATIGVGAATGGAGGIVSGALAAGAGEYARLKLGQKLYNINQDLTDQELFNEALKTAGISLAAGTAGLAVANTIKGVNNLIKGRIVGDDALKVLDDVKEPDQIAKTINDTLDKANINSKVKFTLAQAVDDADMLSTQQAFENVKRLGYMNEFREFGRSQATALNDYFTVLKSGFGTGSGTKPINTFDAGVLIQDVVKKRQNPIINNIVKKQQQSEELLTKSIFRLPDGSSKVTGVEARSIIDDLGKTYKQNVDKAGKALDAATGLKVINTDEIAGAINKLTEKEKKNLINIAKIEGIFKKDVFENISNPSAKVGLDSVRETMQTLGKKIRDKEVGSVTGETVDVGNLKFLNNAFRTQVKKNAGTEYLNELEKFNTLVINNKQLLNNQTLSKLTSIENGILKVADEDVFAETFKRGTGSARAAKETYDVISQSPDALVAYKNSIYDFYKRKVLKDNVPNLTRHKAFMQDYEAPLKQFFSPAEYSKITRIGGLKKSVEDLTKLRKTTSDKLIKSFEGRLETLAPQEIFNKIYKPNNIGEIIKLKNILKNDPEVYRAFQRNVLTDLNERVMATSDRLGMKIISPKRFDNYLNGSGGERGYRVALKEIFGKEYVGNLDILNKALQITGRKGPSRAAEGTVGSAFSDFIRAGTGQFTLTGRLFTAFRRIGKGARERVIANALLNPQSLKELVELRRLKPNSKKAAIILGKLGGSVFTTSEGE